MAKAVVRCEQCGSPELVELTPGQYLCQSCGTKQFPFTEKESEVEIRRERVRPFIPEQPVQERKPAAPAEPERRGTPGAVWAIVGLAVAGLLCCVSVFLLPSLLSPFGVAPPKQIRPTGQLVVTVYRSAGGLQTVGAEIFVYPAGFRSGEVGSSKENPASFALAPGVYDVVANYRCVTGAGDLMVESQVENVTVREAETTEAAVSMHLGTLSMMLMTSDWAYAHVYPDYQHDQSIVHVMVHRGERDSLMLPAATYDLQLTPKYPWSKRDPVWTEGVVVNEGQDTEVELKWPE